MSDTPEAAPGDAGWYDLFSRGARDWLRHNDKVRDAVKQHLPQIVAGADVLTGGSSTVRVPVRMLEHYRFKLRPPKESIKRRGVQTTAGQDSPAFTDEDLRYRQLAKREQPATQAVVILLLDVSGSMGERERQISKTFFFWAIQGLRRQYRDLELVFVAHTSDAWEFQEEEFFRVSGTGGTVASAGLQKVREIIDERFSPAQYNIYLFYASDGENFPSDQPQALEALEDLAQDCNYAGFLEIAPLAGTLPDSEIGKLFLDLARRDENVGAYRVNDTEDIWNAVRHFFSSEAAGGSG